MIKKKYNRHKNRSLNRVWIGLYANRVLNRPGRKTYKGAKGIMGMWGVSKRESPILNMLMAPTMTYTDGKSLWTWEMPGTFKAPYVAGIDPYLE
jgi:hypothetical protein